ncbi:mitochondrial carrier domain-containing protein [Thamnocephalis sphaerospora]|uniref:Mitochondrial carrier domain-containing protein n=1 Tax=Thamnocephalis sphaerospora TaxID=78915 RepID=A0A4P9XPU8_9FUNG|nr:mitochondrial carrier domain-containing protein [Thamnocephalis sphaerospora]|eukprot:RKP08028.1 mitochondrial carrier domain-containing protein [Thamnocephalis sphaerospora]
MSDTAPVPAPAVVSVEPKQQQVQVKQQSSVAASVKSFLSGGFGGMCLVAAGHPLDLIKVRLQTTTLYTGALDCARKTIAKDGVRGLYRGMSAPLVGVTPIFATCFWGYDVGKKLSQSFYGQKAGEPLTMGQICFAGGFSALPATLLMTPIERVKCIIQIQSSLPASEQKYKGTADAARGIWREGGIRGIYKGTAATLLRDVPGSVAYFGAYELFKKWFTPAGKSAGDISPVAVFCAGGLAGMANWAIAIPADVLKSRQQTAPAGTYSGLTDVFVKLMRNEGPSALFRGLGPAMLRAFPANAACFLGVELSLKFMNALF